MDDKHPKSIRRSILRALYDHYQADPFRMLSPDDLTSGTALVRADLPPNIHYLHDSGLVEVMLGYNSALFAGVRITPRGIDLVENHFEFNLRFPSQWDERDEPFAEVPTFVEGLLQEADFAPLDGEERRCLLREILFLRDELARPALRWRKPVIETVLDWIAGHLEDPDIHLPSLAPLRQRLGGCIGKNLPS